MSETLDLAARDLYPVPAELSYNETVEVLVVSAAIVSEEPECLLLPNEEAMDAVRAVMHAGGVAAKRRQYDIHADILQSDAVPRVRSQHAIRLLPVPFPHGF